MDGQVFLDEDDDVYCVWRGEFDEQTNICSYGMDLFQRQGKLWSRSFEEHREYAYSAETLVDYLKQAGFTKIAVYGDYDADGVTASSLLYLYLEMLGADVVCYIPDRETEGYGLNMKAVEALAAEGKEGVLVYGVDFTDDAREAIKAGTMTGSMSYSSARYTKAALQMAVMLNEGHTFDSYVYLPLTLVNVDNVNDLEGWK